MQAQDKIGDDGTALYIVRRCTDIPVAHTEYLQLTT